MAQQNNTPVDFWLSINLPELLRWIKANNAVVQEQKEAKAKAQRTR